jgi:NitT/TauT family transport system permease protein
VSTAGAKSMTGRGGAISPFPHKRTSFVADLLVLAVVFSLFHAMVVVLHHWLGPLVASAPISHDPWMLPRYAGYSLLRIAVAYLLSVSFALVYGYVAAFYPRAERVMIPALDVLQSIPVLSFLPGVMLAMISLFPGRQLGVELGCILLIFTGQAWNIAFSVYASLKSIPTELQEAATAYRFSRWQRLRQLELPYSAIGLIWNSMMSVAGGWFFLMACEMFVLGKRDFRVPGLGSYLQTAASHGDTRSILLGIGTMVLVIVLIDQAIWRPLIAWSEKFKLEQVEAATPRHSTLLAFLRGSRVVAWLGRRVAGPLSERADLFFARKGEPRAEPPGMSRAMRWIARVLLLLAVLAVGHSLVRVWVTISTIEPRELLVIARGAAATLGRVVAALAIGVAWTVPAGVAIGTRPRLARIAQPLVQIAASVPATALFPFILLVLLRMGEGMPLAALLLILLGTQWYILFNVIAGAMAIPADLKEVARVFGLGRLDRWRILILPAIMPQLLTGLVTASGGAWNASIIAEYFHLAGRIHSTTGLGAVISRATDSGNSDQLLLATMVMALVVVTINRLVWQPLQRLAERRYRLDG